MDNTKPIILVDFDGVIHSYTSGWQGEGVIPDEPVEGALEWFADLIATGKFTVAIYSSRSKTAEGVSAMRAYIEHWRILADLPELDYWCPDVKPPAFLTIDDRCIQFNGPGTFPSIEEIENFKPWNKRET